MDFEQGTGHLRVPSASPSQSLVLKNPYNFYPMYRNSASQAAMFPSRISGESQSRLKQSEKDSHFSSFPKESSFLSVSEEHLSEEMLFPKPNNFLQSHIQSALVAERQNLNSGAELQGFQLEEEEISSEEGEEAKRLVSPSVREEENVAQRDEKDRSGLRKTCESLEGAAPVISKSRLGRKTLSQENKSKVSAFFEKVSMSLGKNEKSFLKGDGRKRFSLESSEEKSASGKDKMIASFEMANEGLTLKNEIEGFVRGKKANERPLLEYKELNFPDSSQKIRSRASQLDGYRRDSATNRKCIDLKKQSILGGKKGSEFGSFGKSQSQHRQSIHGLDKKVDQRGRDAHQLKSEDVKAENFQVENSFAEKGFAGHETRVGKDKKREFEFDLLDEKEPAANDLRNFGVGKRKQNSKVVDALKNAVSKKTPNSGLRKIQVKREISVRPGRDSLQEVVDSKQREFKWEIRDFVITGKLGRGGFGEVYKASHPRLNEEVAVKSIALVDPLAMNAEYRGPSVGQRRSTLAQELKVKTKSMSLHINSFVVSILLVKSNPVFCMFLVQSSVACF